jgi:transcriptional regulator with XRE-family HTH domain
MTIVAEVEHPLDARALGARIRALREGKGMVQKEVADLLGVAQNAYSARERGRTPFPVHELHLLAGLFGKTIDYLAGRTEETVPLHDDDIEAVVARYRAHVGPVTEEEHPELLRALASFRLGGRGPTPQLAAQLLGVIRSVPPAKPHAAVEETRRGREEMAREAEEAQPVRRRRGRPPKR